MKGPAAGCQPIVSAIAQARGGRAGHDAGALIESNVATAGECAPPRCANAWAARTGIGPSRNRSCFPGRAADSTIARGERFFVSRPRANQRDGRRSRPDNGAIRHVIPGLHHHHQGEDRKERRRLSRARATRRRESSFPVTYVRRNDTSGGACYAALWRLFRAVIDQPLVEWRVRAASSGSRLALPTLVQSVRAPASRTSGRSLQRGRRSQPMPARTRGNLPIPPTAP